MRYKAEKGAITVEATISLSAFMFAIVTILSIINICTVQAKIGVAINTTAKELSQYCYLYSLTGFAESEAKLRENGVEDTQELNAIMGNIGTVFDEIQNLGEGNPQSDIDVDTIMADVESKIGSVENIEAAGSAIGNSLETIAEDPKSLIMGMAKMLASDGLELAKSKIIAAPLSKGLCKKHLVNSSESDVEAYLKSLGIVPGADGKYLSGLDFSESTLFPYGSNEITVSVNYKVKVIPLLPIDFEYEFRQTAITNGWLAGEATYKSEPEYIEDPLNNSIWVTATVSERSRLIRSMGIDDLLEEGYQKTSGLTDVQLYNPTKNEFVMIASMNPLYSPADEETIEVEDINKDAVKESLERLCGKINSTTDGRDTVNTKIEENGNTTKKENSCINASNKIVLVIPEDDGLQELFQEIINEMDTKGVTFELITSYGSGKNKLTTESETGGE